MLVGTLVKVAALKVAALKGGYGLGQWQGRNKMTAFSVALGRDVQRGNDVADLFFYLALPSLSPTLHNVTLMYSTMRVHRTGT